MPSYGRAVVPGVALALLATATAVLPGSARQTPPALAFPGAVGFGSGATGDAGGSVVHVTNLDDYQAGDTAGNSSGHFSHDVIGNYFANITSLGRAGSLWSGQQATGLDNDGYGDL